MYIDMSEEPAASIMVDDKGGRRFFWDIMTPVPDYTGSQP
jgi:hypothetical protein